MAAPRRTWIRNSKGKSSDFGFAIRATALVTAGAGTIVAVALMSELSGLQAVAIPTAMHAPAQRTAAPATAGEAAQPSSPSQVVQPRTGRSEVRTHILGFVTCKNGVEVTGGKVYGIPAGDSRLALLEEPSCPKAAELLGACTVAEVEPTGRFDLQLRDAGEYVVLAMGQNIAPVALTATSGGADLRIEAEPAKVVRGKVVDSAKQPIPLALIAAVLPRTERIDSSIPLADRFLARAFRREAVSTATGEFEITGLNSGPFVVFAIHPDYATAKQIPVTPDSSPLELTMLTGATLRGVVRDGEMKPIANAGIAVARSVSTGELQESGDGFTDAEGRFEIPNVLAGGHSLMVKVLANGFATRVYDLDPLEAHESRFETFVLERGDLLRVRIVGPDKAPIAGAVVEAYGLRDRSFVGGAQTRPDGLATISGVGAGLSYRVMADADGFVLGTLPQVTPTGTAELMLLPAVTLKGRLVNESGVGVPGQVMLRRENDRDLIMENTQVTADENGEFTISELTPGVVTLLAQSPELAPAVSPPIGLVVGMDPVTVVLSAGERWAGRIVDAQGKPIAQASVSLAENSRASGRVRGDLGTPSTTDANGAFRFDRVPVETTRLIVRIDGMAPRIVEVAQHTKAMGERNLGTLSIDDGGDAVGIVRNSKGVPTAGAVVSFSGNVTISGAAPSAVTDSEGRFEIRGIAAGTYGVDVVDPAECQRAGALRRTSTEVVIEPRKTTQIQIDGSTFGRVRGKVFYAGAAPSQAFEVMLFSLGEVRRECGSAQTSFDGAYVLDVPETGRYMLELRSLEGTAVRAAYELHLTAREEMHLDLEVGRAAIRGTVTSPDTRKPVAGARVYVRDATGRRCVVMAGPDGQFTMLGLNCDRVSISAHAPGYAPAQQKEIELLPSGFTECDIEMLAQSTILVRALDPSKRPVSGVRVVVWDEEMNIVEERFTDGQGEAYIGSLGNSKYTVTFEHSQFEETEVPLTLGKEDNATHVIEMKRVGNMVVSVLGLDGNPAPYLGVEITTSSGAIHRSASGADGMLRVEGVAEGEASIQLEGGGHQKTVVKGGETTTTSVSKEK
ncbi:MAG: carboxypeptidase regulatory-like domain-containing protein [Planctomycetes bacterium]|nr:carboxypeptidase regulatory-like domain-containing protein [Planctomycetota bacterium]